jgi:isoleucyl-tRNA synthetase
MESTITEELNIKRLIISLDPGSLADVVLKPQFKTLGKKLGTAIKDLQAAMSEATREAKSAALEGLPITIASWTLSPDEYVVELRPSGNRLVATDRELVASLNPEISEALRLEGIARELVSSVQKARKAAGYEVEDRIQLRVRASDDLLQAIMTSQAYIEEETLSKLVTALGQPDYAEHIEIDNERMEIELTRT